MKEIILLIFLASFSNFIYSQNILKYVDYISNDVLWLDEGTTYIEDNAGFRLRGQWKYNSNKPNLKGFSAKVIGIGDCIEDVELIILFENGKTIKKLNYNGFNCEGVVFYSLNKKELKLLSSSSIDKVRFTNKMTNYSITGELEDPYYFIFLDIHIRYGMYHTLSE